MFAQVKGEMETKSSQSGHAGITNPPPALRVATLFLTSSSSRVATIRRQPELHFGDFCGFHPGDPLSEIRPPTTRLVDAVSPSSWYPTRPFAAFVIALGSREKAWGHDPVRTWTLLQASFACARQWEVECVFYVQAFEINKSWSPFPKSTQQNQLLSYQIFH